MRCNSQFEKKHSRIDFNLGFAQQDDAPENRTWYYWSSITPSGRFPVISDVGQTENNAQCIAYLFLITHNNKKTEYL